MGAIFEVQGKYQVGDRCWVDGKPHRVTRVLGHTNWTPDRIEDEDEFGRDPGWYSEVEAAPDRLTAEEEARIGAEEAEKAARREQAREANRAYRAALDHLRVEHERLTVGLERAPNCNLAVLQGLAREEIGVACEPGKGCSGTTELVAYRDPSGAVAAISFGCPYDLGPAFWLAPELLAEGADRARIWQWWNPSGYHADTYPGPGVPLDTLTPEERAEVEQLERARLVAIREREKRIDSTVRSRLEDEGLLVPAEKRHVAPRPCNVKARSYSLEFGPEFETYVGEYAAYMRARTGTRPTLRGLTVRVVLGPEAYAKKGRKPAPIDLLPRTLQVHNYAVATVVYERGE